MKARNAQQVKEHSKLPRSSIFETTGIHWLCVYCITCSTTLSCHWLSADRHTRVQRAFKVSVRYRVPVSVNTNTTWYHQCISMLLGPASVNTSTTWYHQYWPILVLFTPWFTFYACSHDNTKPGIKWVQACIADISHSMLYAFAVCKAISLRMCMLS